MPIFDYACEGCGHRFERLALAGDDPAPRCPRCDSGQVRKLMSPGSVRPQGIAKGSGGFKPPACARKGR